MWINASKCWPPAGPVKWMDMITPHATHPSGVRAVRLTHFVPAGDVLAYGQPSYASHSKIQAPTDFYRTPMVRIMSSQNQKRKNKF